MDALFDYSSSSEDDSELYSRKKRKVKFNTDPRKKLKSISTVFAAKNAVPPPFEFKVKRSFKICGPNTGASYDAFFTPTAALRRERIGASFLLSGDLELSKVESAFTRLFEANPVLSCRFQDERWICDGHGVWITHSTSFDKVPHNFGLNDTHIFARDHSFLLNFHLVQFPSQSLITFDMDHRFGDSFTMWLILDLLDKAFMCQSIAQCSILTEALFSEKSPEMCERILRNKGWIAVSLNSNPTFPKLLSRKRTIRQTEINQLKKTVASESGLQWVSTNTAILSTLLVHAPSGKKLSVMTNVRQEDETHLFGNMSTPHVFRLDWKKNIAAQVHESIRHNHVRENWNIQQKHLTKAGNEDKYVPAKLNQLYKFNNFTSKVDVWKETWFGLTPNVYIPRFTGHSIAIYSARNGDGVEVWNHYRKENADIFEGFFES